MILYLQQFLANKFNNNLKILNEVQAVYIQTMAKSSFPYIFIGDFNSKHVSTQNTQLAEIFFKVIIFTRDKNITPMLKLSNKIKELLHIDGDNKIVLMRCLKESVNINYDGITQQVTLNFKAIICGDKNNV